MKEILLATCGAFVCVNMLQLHMIFKWNRKPLNCDVCISGWFCLLLSVPYVYWLHIPFYMAAAMVTTAVLNSVLKR